MTIQSSKIGFLVFHGHGFVTGQFPCSIVTSVSNVIGNVWDVTVLYTPIYNPAAYDMEQQVGSRIVTKNFGATPARNIPDDEYTLVQADNAANTFTFRGEFAAPPTVGGLSVGTQFRIEDFYKFCNAPAPDFVTGDAAKARWITCMTKDGLSLSLGQKIDIINAGFASVDGVTVELTYNTDENFRKLIQLTIPIVEDTNNFIIATDRMDQDITIPGRVTAAGYRRTLPTDVTIDFRMAFNPSGPAGLLPSRIIADDPNLFEFAPIWLNQEAVIIRNQITAINNSGLNVQRSAVERGVLRTPALLQAPSTIMIDSMPGAEGQLCQILTLNSDDLYLQLEQEQFYGLAENLIFSDYQNTVTIEISDISLTGFRQKFAAKLTDRIAQTEYGSNANEPMTVTINSDNQFLTQNESAGNWRWVKVGKACMRLENRRKDLTDPTTAAYVDDITPIVDEFGNPVYQLNYRIYPVFQGEGFERYDDWYLVEATSDSAEDGVYGAPKVLGETDSGVTGVSVSGRVNADNSYLIQSGLGGNQLQDNTFGASGTRQPGVVCLDVSPDAPQEIKLELAHMFEQADGSIDIEGFLFAGGDGTSFGRTTQNFLFGFSEKRLPAGVIAMQILTSGDGLVGGSTNGPFDVLPYNVGLGIDLARIDYESFGFTFDETTGRYSFNPKNIRCRAKGADRWAQTTFVNPHITIDDTKNIADWMNKNLLKPLAVGIGVTLNENTGLREIRAFSLADIQPRTGEELAQIQATTVSEADFFKVVGESIQTSMETKGTDIVESVSYRFDQLTKPHTRRSPKKTTIKAVPIAPYPNSSEVVSYAKLFTFIQSRPILEEMKLYPAWRDDKSFGIGQLSRLASLRISQFAKVLPKLKFVTDLTSSVRFSVGDRIILNSITPVLDLETGLRGKTALAYVLEQKTDVLRGLIENEVILVTDPTNIDFSLWSASGEISAVAAPTIFDIQSNVYVNPPLTDPDTFAPGDELLLFDENFVLLSEDALGDPDPQQIDSIVGNTITMVGAFTDSVGAVITPSATDIIVLASRLPQPVATQRTYAYQNDNESTWSS
jgi:hypothetical protein